MKVLIATDGSDCSRHAMREAARLLPLREAEVHLVSVAVLPPVGMEPMAFGLPASGIASPLVEDLEGVAAEALDKAADELAPLGVTPQVHRAQGDAAQEILRLAETLRPDVVVVGSHGRNAVERLFLGSVSDSLVRHFPGPVLVVRPPREET